MKRNKTLQDFWAKSKERKTGELYLQQFCTENNDK